jgi:hypothetical protein
MRTTTERMRQKCCGWRTFPNLLHNLNFLLLHNILLRLFDLYEQDLISTNILTRGNFVLVLADITVTSIKEITIGTGRS